MASELKLLSHSIVIFLLLISANRCSQHELTGGDLCTFPVPGNNEFFDICSYTVARMLVDICDSASFFSLEQINLLRLHVENKTLYHSRQLGFGMLIARHLSLPFYNPLHSFEESNKTASRFCSRAQHQQSVPIRRENFVWNKSLAMEYLKFYAEVLRDRWFEKHVCKLNNVFLLVFTSGIKLPTAPYRSVTTDPVVVVAVSQTVRDRISKADFKDIPKISSHCSEPSLFHSVFLLFDDIHSHLLAWEHGAPTNLRGIPHWAIYTFAGCGGLAITAFVVDWLIISRKRLQSKNSRSHNAFANATAAKPWKASGIIAAMIRRKQQHQQFIQNPDYTNMSSVPV